MSRNLALGLCHEICGLTDVVHFLYLAAIVVALMVLPIIVYVASRLITDFVLVLPYILLAALGFLLVALGFLAVWGIMCLIWLALRAGRFFS
jgi:hypothetical protein